MSPITTSGSAIEPIDVAYHRNGVAGEPFYAVTFAELVRATGEKRRMLAVVFPPDRLTDEGETDWYAAIRGRAGNPRVAMFDLDLLPDVGFGSNSWRGDEYAPALYAAIEASE